MFRLISRVQIAYVGLFVIVCAGVFAYEGLYIWPMQQCESGGGWWSAKYRECATPMPIWRFTGRKPGTPAAAAGGVLVRGAVPIASAPAATRKAS
jgi:hypothetical protein